MEIKKIIRLYSEDQSSNGANIQICPNPDAPDSGVCIMTDHSKESVEWFGKNRFWFSSTELRVFGEACINYADSYEKDMA